MKILSMTLRAKAEEGWQFVYFREGDASETVVEDVSAIENEITALQAFVESQKSPEEQAQEQAQQKILDMLTVITDSTTDEEKLKLLEVYPEYQNGVQYSKDDPVPYIRYEGKLYKIIAATFTSQPDWTPDVAKSLFVEVLPPGTIGEWKQPTGAHDAYKIGDRVIFDGWVWCSIINANTWSPSAYPQGWEKEREV